MLAFDAERQTIAVFVVQVTNRPGCEFLGSAMKLYRQSLREIHKWKWLCIRQ